MRQQVAGCSIPKHPTDLAHGAEPSPLQGQPLGSLELWWAPTLCCWQLALVELLEALLVGLAVVVDLRLRRRVELDVADLAEGERLLLLLSLQALLGLAGRAAAHLHQPHPTLGAVGWAQRSLHACGRKDRPAVRTGGGEQVRQEPSAGPAPVGCPGLPGPVGAPQATASAALQGAAPRKTMGTVASPGY